MIKPEYGSHLPVLLRLVEATTGPILELGMGGYSTPMLDLMCRKTERGLASYDNDKEWFSENEKWRSAYHAVSFVSDWEKVPLTIRHWSVALIDHRPAIRRRKDAVRLKDHADFIVLHDSEPEIDRFYGYSSIYHHFKYRYDYAFVRPHTTVVSNFYDPTPYLAIDRVA